MRRIFPEQPNHHPKDLQILPRTNYRVSLVRRPQNKATLLPIQALERELVVDDRDDDVTDVCAGALFHDNRIAIQDAGIESPLTLMSRVFAGLGTRCASISNDSGTASTAGLGTPARTFSATLRSKNRRPGLRRLSGALSSNSSDLRRWTISATEALDRNTAARIMELPVDRMGDIVVCSARNWVIGRTPEYHDLKAIEGGLRSHGGRYEEMVPFILSRPLKPEYAARARGDLRNFHLFDFAINGTVAS